MDFEVTYPKISSAFARKCVPGSRQVAFLQQLERAIDRRIANVRVDLGIKLLCADVPSESEEYARDVVALTGSISGRARAVANGT
jgi:hypothetical protein